MSTEDYLVVIIEDDADHIQHLWADLGHGYQDEGGVCEEVANLESGEWSAYGVTTARVCACCDQVSEHYVTALWGCVVETPSCAGTYELHELGMIPDEYLREVARELIEEAKVSS